MLAFRIIATVFLGLSFGTCLVKNINIFSDAGRPIDNNHDKAVIVATIYGWLWRAFVIVAIWIV